MRTIKARRRANKTDYKARLSLLKPSVPRIIIRRTNRYIIAQAVESHEAQDKVIKGISSKELLKHGWDSKSQGSLKSIPAAYLTGMLLAKKLEGKRYIIDTGMARNIAGSRIYAVVKGLIDGGKSINADPSSFPSEERLKGEHTKLKDIVKKTKEKI